MSKLTKTQVYSNVVSEVEELLKNSKISKKFQDELYGILDNYLKPKNSEGSSQHPPILNEDGTIKEAYCRFHQRYEPGENMVMSKGKSKGYCKASISLWNKTNSEIKKLESKAVESMSNGEFEEAQKFAKEAKELKDNFNKPEFYDYDRDWSNFNKSE